MGLFKDCGCGCNGKKQEQKFTISVISALTFFLVANPQTYILTRRLLGAGLSSVNGNPTLLGLFIHSIVFLLIVWAMMNIRQEKYEAPAPAKAEAKGRQEGRGRRRRRRRRRRPEPRTGSGKEGSGGSHVHGPRRRFRVLRPRGFFRGCGPGADDGFAHDVRVPGRYHGASRS
jgi:hypothetical protein